MLSIFCNSRIDPVAHTGFLPFLNPPFVALMFAMLVPLGLQNAYIVFLGINVSLILLMCIIALAD